MDIGKDTIIRTAILALAFFNQLLSACGKSPLPIDDIQMEMLVSTIFTMITAIAAWWKNNSFTKGAIEADLYLKRNRKRWRCR